MPTATTFTYKGVELTQVDQEVPSPLPPVTKGGRVRVVRFSVTTTAGAADASTIELCRLPTGAVILSGAVKWADLDSGAGTMDIGTDDGTAAPTAIASALNTSAAGSVALPEAVALTPIVLDAPTSVYATLNEGTAVLAGAVSGYLLYVENS